MSLDGKAVLKGVSLEKREMEARIFQLISNEIASFKERTGVVVSDVDISISLHQRIGMDDDTVLTGVSIRLLLP